ncbi:peptidoglycan recognition protein 1-like [Mixophyes fleayi]|uniref:peptidoglycan recognition protein 1-like n=1 Tax=Mixophyes fleayi TaxID=3061075 RepID=UPI003F4D73DD
MIRLLVLLSVLCVAANGCPNIVTRLDWKAKDYTCTEDLTTPVKYVIIQHTEGASCLTKTKCIAEVKIIQKADAMTTCGIGYNFLIGGDGLVYEGRGWTTQGNHTKDYSSNSIGISFMGNFTVEVPSNPAIDAAKSLIAWGMYNHTISKCYILNGHYSLSPEDSLYSEIKGWRDFQP